MDSFRKAWRSLRYGGPWCLLGRLGAVLYSREEYWLLQSRYNSGEEALPEPPEEMRFRRAGRQDVPRLLEAYPPEFGWLSRKPALLREVLADRLASGMRCFVLEDASGIAAGVWCSRWRGDCLLPPDERRAPAYEITNLFTVPRARGRGLASALLRLARQAMAQEGARTGYAAVLPHRFASLRAHRKAGFVVIGRADGSTVLGRRHVRLDREARPAETSDARPG